MQGIKQTWKSFQGELSCWETLTYAFHSDYCTSGNKHQKKCSRYWSISAMYKTGAQKRIREQETVCRQLCQNWSTHGYWLLWVRFVVNNRSHVQCTKCMWEFGCPRDFPWYLQESLEGSQPQAADTEKNKGCILITWTLSASSQGGNRNIRWENLRTAVQPW